MTQAAVINYYEGLLNGHVPPSEVRACYYLLAMNTVYRVGRRGGKEQETAGASLGGAE